MIDLKPGFFSVTKKCLKFHIYYSEKRYRRDTSQSVCGVEVPETAEPLSGLSLVRNYIRLHKRSPRDVFPCTDYQWRVSTKRFCAFVNGVHSNETRHKLNPNIHTVSLSLCPVSCGSLTLFHATLMKTSSHSKLSLTTSGLFYQCDQVDQLKF